MHVKFDLQKYWIQQNTIVSTSWRLITGPCKDFYWIQICMTARVQFAKNSFYICIFIHRMVRNCVQNQPTSNLYCAVWLNQRTLLQITCTFILVLVNCMYILFLYYCVVQIKWDCPYWIVHSSTVSISYRHHQTCPKLLLEWVKFSWNQNQSITQSWSFSQSIN